MIWVSVSVVLRLPWFDPLDVVEGLHDDGHLSLVNEAVVVDVIELERPVELFLVCKEV